MNRDVEQALRALAATFAVKRDDLERIASSLDASPTPLVGDFAAEAAALLVGRTLDTYRHHIQRLITELGHRRLDEVSLLDLERVAGKARADAMDHPSSRHGYGAQESFINATRFVFLCGVKAGHLRDNPAAGLARPRRRRSPRRALSADELRSLFNAVLVTSRDPGLDLLIVAFARETACRREGILHLRRADLSPAPSVILYEKFDEKREIPVSTALLGALQLHADDRAPRCEGVFHYADGRCLTERRFDTIFHRVGRVLPWASSLGVSLHWIRYSTLTDVRITSGERVASAYAGHGDHSGGITAQYTRASFEELQQAHHQLFG